MDADGVLGVCVLLAVLAVGAYFAVLPLGRDDAMRSGCKQSCRMVGRIADEGRLCICDDGRVLRRDSAHWYVPVKGRQ